MTDKLFKLNFILDRRDVVFLAMEDTFLVLLPI